MLNLSATNIALSMLSTSPLRIAPAPGSLLNSVTATVTPVAEVKDDMALTEHLLSVSSNLMQTDTPAASQHTLFVDNFVKEVAPLLKRHIDFARNTGKAMVQECYDSLNQRFSEQKARPANEAFTVQQHTLPSVLEHGMVQHLLGSLPEDAKIPDQINQIRMPAYDRVKLIEFLSSGGKSFLTAVQEWVLTIPDDTILQAWRSYFIGGSSGSITGESHMFEGDALARLTSALLVLLWAERFISQVPEDYRGLGVNQLDYELRRLQTMAITVIRGAVRELSSMVSLGNFVLGYDRKTSTLRVLAPTYQAWLQNGGDVTVLLGMMSSNNIIRQRVALDAEAAKLVQKWQLYEAMTIRLFEEQRAMLFQDIALRWYLDSLNSLSVEETEYSARNPAWLEQVKQNGKLYIRSRKVEDFQDLVTFSMELVAKIRLGFTAAYPMLKGIHEARSVNPKLDVREAAVLAAIDYVAEYLADQTTVIA